MLVLRNQQIEQAVAVVVYESTAGTPLLLRSCNPGCARNLREGAVAVIAVEGIGSPIGHEQIGRPAVIEVAGTYRATPARAPQPARGRYILKAALSGVAIESVRWFASLGEPL